MENHNKRSEIIREINLAKIDAAIKDIPSFRKKIEAFKELLKQDIVTIKEEIEEDEEILRDLNKILASEYSESSKKFPTILPSEFFNELSDLKSNVEKCLKLQQTFRDLLIRYYKILKTEFRICEKTLAAESLPETRKLAIFLNALFFQYEKYIVSALPGPKNAKSDLSSVYFGTKIIDELSDVELEFIRECTLKMGDSEDDLYRPLGEFIMTRLLKKSGPWRSSNWESCLAKFEALSEDTGAITESIAEFCVKSKNVFSKEEMSLLSKTFKQAIEHEHFKDLLQEFLDSKLNR